MQTSLYKVVPVVHSRLDPFTPHSAANKQSQQRNLQARRAEKFRYPAEAGVTTAVLMKHDSGVVAQIKGAGIQHLFLPDIYMKRIMGKPEAPAVYWSEQTSPEA